MMKKKLIFWVLLIVMMVLVLDTMLYWAMYKVNTTRNLFYERTDIDKERIAFWLQNSYDPFLGWDLPFDERNNLNTRRNEDYPIQDSYKIKTFGDSFTYGAEVEVKDTWQAIVEARTGWNCLNYGVGAFGTDQAFLKYKSNHIKTEYTVLGILCENIGRTASIYPAFYMRAWAPPKPRFVMKNHAVELIENPISAPDSAFRLLDNGFVERLKKYDYWPYYYEDVLHAPAKLVWPALYTIFSHLPFFFERAQIEFKRKFNPSYEIDIQSYKYCHLYEQPSEIFEVFTYLIGEFVALCQERGEHPIILVFPDQFSIDLMKKYNKNPYQPLVDFLNDRQYDFLDFGSMFVNEKYVSYYNTYNSHYSPLGNSRVANELIAFLRKLDSEKEISTDK